MLLYIDYLDYTTRHSSTFSEVDKRLRFDLLIYSGGDTLCISVPACVKLGSTTKLLMQLDQFWKTNKILLQLDKKHKGNVCNYFRNRKRVLEKSIHEEELIQHFEYKAYQSGRIQTFFENYLFQGLKIQSADIFINKINDTDALFRKECVNLFEKTLMVFAIIWIINVQSNLVVFHIEYVTMHPIKQCCSNEQLSKKNQQSISASHK